MNQANSNTKENLPNKPEKNLVVYNRVVVRIMINMNLKKQKIKENQQGLLLDLEASMEVLEVKILLSLDIIMKINLEHKDVMILTQRDRLLTPVKLVNQKKMMKILKK